MPQNYGEIIPYDPLWKGPFEVHRRKTDPKVLNIFWIFMAIWLAVGAYAFYTHGNAVKPNDVNLNININVGQDKDVNQFINNFPNDFHKNENILSAYHDKYDQYFKNITDNIWTVLGFTAFSAILCLVYTFMMRHFAKVIVYIYIFIFWAFLIIILVVLFSASDTQEKSKDIKLAVEITLVIVLVVSIIVVIIFRKKISIACGIIKEATKTVLFFPTHFLLPIAVSPMILGVFVLTGLISFWLHAADALQKEQSSGRFVFHSILHVYNICSLFWSWNFIAGTKQMILSASFATWYWTLNKQYVPNNTVSNSISTVSRFHLGTIAFGSMIITICQIIKIILKGIARKAQESGNGAEQCVTSCFAACGETLEKYVKYINRNAYIMSAVHGTDFFTSAKNAFNLIMRNIMNVAATTEVTAILFGVGKILTISIPAVIAWLLTESSKNQNIGVHVALTVVVLSYIVTSCFFTILHSAIDTVFLCVIEDFERNDGSAERPYYMSYKLKNLLLSD